MLDLKQNEIKKPTKTVSNIGHWKILVYNRVGKQFLEQHVFYDHICVKKIFVDVNMDDTCMKVNSWKKVWENS